MSEFNEGDLVEVEKGELLVRGRVVERGAAGAQLRVEGVGFYFKKRDGFTVSVIEKAAPKLPTEPGIYVDGYGNAWRRFASTSQPWTSSGCEYYDDEAAGFAPFTRLEPVPVTARKVIEFLEAGLSQGHIAFKSARKEFGVE